MSAAKREEEKSPYPKERVHSYQASATAFGGVLDRPVAEPLPVLASSALPSVGGYHSSRHEKFSLRELISIDEAYTHVAGSGHPERGGWVTVATSVIKGLNVGHFLYADKILAQITVEHPAHGHSPAVSFLGTQYVGLRIGDQEIHPTLKLDLCEVPHTRGFPTEPYLENKKFLEETRQRSKDFSTYWLGQKGKDEQPLRRMAYLHEDGDNTAADVKERGTVMTSLVCEIEGEWTGGPKYGHAIYVPGFGRIYLGELVVANNYFNLTMLRLDLGSSIGGKASGPTATVAGGTKGGPIGGNSGTG
jgi:hypothetical protein